MSARERILKAAGQFFGTKPYSEVSIAPILQVAEVQAPTLYYHFKDKEGLYVDWATKAFTPLKGQLQIRNPETLEAALASFSAILFNASTFDITQVVRDIPGLDRDASKEAVYGAYFQAVYEPLCAILIEGMERGELPPEPVGRIADLFLANVFALESQADRDPAGIAAWIARRFLHGHRA